MALVFANQRCSNESAQNEWELFKKPEINRTKNVHLHQVELFKFMKLLSVDQRPSFLQPLIQPWNT